MMPLSQHLRKRFSGYTPQSLSTITRITLQSLAVFPDNTGMTDQEPNGEHTQYHGGSAADGEQAYGGESASAQVPTPADPQDAYRSPYARPIPAPASESSIPDADQAAQPTAQPGYGQPVHGQEGYSQPGYSQASYARPGYGQPVQPQAPAYGQPVQPQAPAYGQPQAGPQPYTAQPYGAQQPYAAQQSYSTQPPYGQQPYAQPGGSPSIYPGTQAAGDVLIAGPKQRSRRMAPAVISVIAVLAIILGAGGFTAYKLLAASGSQPDKWAPANSMFYAKIDLDPSASAKLAAWQFEQKFPAAPKIASADDLKDGLLQAVFESDPTAPVDYNADVKPWIGDRAAVAVFADSGGKPQTVGILAVKDSGKAKAGLAKITQSDPSGPIGYTVKGSFVIIGATQAIVDDAVEAAAKSNLTGNADYKKDITTLNGDRIATAWWDLGATTQALASRLPGGAGMLLMNGAAGAPDLSKTRVVMGLRVLSSSVELEARAFGVPAATELQPADVSQAIGNLPGNTVFGVSIANPEQLVKNELKTLQSGLVGNAMQSEFANLGAQLGISVPGDIENLLGSQLTVGVGSDSSKGPVRVVTTPDDASKGLQTARILAHALSQDSGQRFTASAQGSSVVITNDTGAAAGKLADSQSFKNALAGMPAKTTAVGYVNLAALIAAAGNDANPNLKPLDSIGFYSGKDATSDVTIVRLTVK